MTVQKVDSKVVDASLFFQEAQVEALHEKICSHEVHPRDELSQTIDTVNLINVKTLSPAAREKFQSLCGRLHKINTNMMIDAIVDETQSLKKSGVRNPKDIKVLRQSIAEIWQNNRSLSEVDSNLLRVASITLAELSSGKKPDVVNTSHTHFNQEMQVLPESTVKGTEVSADWEEAELAFELLDIAGLFYQGKISEGLEMVKTLPSGIKLPPISEKSSANEIATFIQEAVIKSFEIGRKDGYTPSAHEIQELLEEAASLS